MPPVVSPLEIARRERDLTQLALATRAGVARETVSRIERGEWPRLRTARAIAQALGVELSVILNLPETSNADTASAGVAKSAVQATDHERYRAA